MKSERGEGKREDRWRSEGGRREGEVYPGLHVHDFRVLTVWRFVPVYEI